MKIKDEQIDKKSMQFGYVPQLDGMRGIAILAVIGFHAGFSFLSGGFFGVDIFFVLSGFLITSLLLKEYDKYEYINLKHFYLRRALRLLPALILLLFIFTLASIIFLNWQDARSNLLDAGIVLFYVANWARAFQIHGAGWLGHAWSLSIEEQFYILWPTLLIFLLKRVQSKRKIFYIIVLLAVLSWLLRLYLISSGALTERIYNGLDTRADSLLTGCALGVFLSSDILTAKLKDKLSKLLQYFYPMAILILIGVIISANLDGLYVYKWLLGLVEISTAFLILAIFISEKSVLKRFLSIKPLVWIGSISYGLYLWHYPIFSLLWHLHQDSLILSVGIPASFIIATCSYYFWERPFLKLKKKLSLPQKPIEMKNGIKESIPYAVEKQKNDYSDNDG
jgi:peptidoglycan/LPS O-acetylase OafA/YrhL